MEKYVLDYGNYLAEAYKFHTNKERFLSEEFANMAETKEDLSWIYREWKLPRGADEMGNELYNLRIKKK